jgi:pantothenate kinase
LIDIDKDDVGDIVYLEGKYIIKGEPLIGKKYSLWIKITSAGIEFVEKVIDRFIENIENTRADNDEAKFKVKELSKENNISKKVKSIIEFAKTNTDLWLEILNIMGLLLRG